MSVVMLADGFTVGETCRRQENPPEKNGKETNIKQYEFHTTSLL
jgi:hypothetical protein